MTMMILNKKIRTNTLLPTKLITLFYPTKLITLFNLNGLGQWILYIGIEGLFITKPKHMWDFEWMPNPITTIIV